MQAAIEAMKTGVQETTEAASPTRRSNEATMAINTSIRTHGPSLKQPTFDCKA